MKFFVFINLIKAESFDGRFGQTGPRSFVAPDLTNIQLQLEVGQLRPEDVPKLSEFNYYDPEGKNSLPFFYLTVLFNNRKYRKDFFLVIADVVIKLF